MPRIGKGKPLQNVPDMLSFPKGWDYTIKGLACICKDGMDSIGSTLKELEQNGYLTRQRIRFENGR